MPADTAPPIVTEIEPRGNELEQHERFYLKVVRGIWIFVAHVAVILLVMAYFLG